MREEEEGLCVSCGIGDAGIQFPFDSLQKQHSSQ